MAITKIGVYRNPPEDMTDFQAISELLMAYARDIGGQGMILTEWTNTDEWPKLAMGSYIFHGGASYVVDTEDYTIGEPSDGTHYLRIAASGETLTVSWISSLSGYVWNPIYNGLYHADQSQILPYQLVVAGASREKWKITNLAQGGGYVVANWQGAVRVAGPMDVAGPISSGGAISGTHINTGQGDFKVGQNLRTTDSPTFAQITTTNGPNKPVDNNDASMPSVGIGGFTFGVVANGNITLPPGGTIMVIAFLGNGFSVANSGRKSGGSVLNFPNAKGNVFAWRIA